MQNDEEANIESDHVADWKKDCNGKQYSRCDNLDESVESHNNVEWNPKSEKAND